MLTTMAKVYVSEKDNTIIIAIRDSDILISDKNLMKVEFEQARYHPSWVVTWANDFFHGPSFIEFDADAQSDPYCRLMMYIALSWIKSEHPSISITMNERHASEMKMAENIMPDCNMFRRGWLMTKKDIYAIENVIKAWKTLE